MLPKLRVRLSPVWGIAFLVVAAIDLYLWTFTHQNVQLIFAATMALIGISHLMGALLVIDDRTIELKNPLGMTLKTFVIDTPGDLTMEGRKLWVRQGSDKKKISGLMANRADWAQLAKAIADASS